MTKILEKIGIENTGIDAARFNRFCSGYKDGIIKKSFDECAVSLISSNIFQISKGELLICGYRVVSDSSQFTFNTFPSDVKRYQIVAQLSLDDSRQPVFQYLAREVADLRQDDLLNENISEPIYQVEMARFTLTTDSITDLSRTIDIMSGSSIQSGAIKIGTVETTKISTDLDAEVDIEEVINSEGERQINFVFNLPIDFSNLVEDLSNQVLEKVNEEVGISPIYVHHINVRGQCSVSFGYDFHITVASPSKSAPFTDFIEFLNYMHDRRVDYAVNPEIPASGFIYSGSPTSGSKIGDVLGFAYDGQMRGYIAFRYRRISDNTSILTQTMTAEYKNGNITHKSALDDLVFTMN